MGSGDSTRRGKVQRLIDEYGLHDIGAELERRWTGVGVERSGLRELARRFNRRLTERAMIDAGMDVLDGEARNVYRLLTADDVSSGTRVQTENRLARNGIDVDRLRSDFVSRQAIHTYLTEHRGVEYEAPTSSGDDHAQRRTEALRRLRSRAVAVTERTVADLRDAGLITVGEFDVLVTIRIRCRECGTQRDVIDLLSGNGCKCGADSTA